MSARRAIPVQFIASPLAVDEDGARLLLNKGRLSRVAWRACWYRFRARHDIRPIPGLGRAWPVKEIVKAVEEKATTAR